MYSTMLSHRILTSVLTEICLCILKINVRSRANARAPFDVKSTICFEIYRVSSLCMVRSLISKLIPKLRAALALVLECYVGFEDHCLTSLHCLFQLLCITVFGHDTLHR
jgi:hypothetical protein